jgi:hypothetical protein
MRHDTHTFTIDHFDKFKGSNVALACSGNRLPTCYINAFGYQTNMQLAYFPSLKTGLMFTSMLNIRGQGHLSALTEYKSKYMGHRVRAVLPMSDVQYTNLHDVC